MRILLEDSAARRLTSTDPWVKQAKLTADDGAEDDEFGSSLSISGDTIVVGASYDGNLPYGSATIFYRNHGGSDNWGKVTKITPSDDSYQDGFGCCVSISGDTLIVGSYADNAPRLSRSDKSCHIC